MNRRTIAVLAALFILASATLVGSQTNIGTGSRFGMDGRQFIITHSMETDPCQSSGVAKSSAAINISSATTTQLVAPSGTTSVYVCGATFTIAPSATSADSISFITGTGGTCGGSTVTKTGTFGAGDLTTAAPVVAVSFSDPGTSFSGAAGSGLCAVSAGTTVNIQGFVTYVQQ